MKVLKETYNFENEAVVESKVLYAEKNNLKIITEADQAFLDKLADFPLSTILTEINSLNGVVDWEFLNQDNHN